MSCCALGTGWAILKEGTDISELEAKIYDLDFMVYYIWDGHISFSDEDEYFEEDTMEFLNTLNSYITEGSIVYSGEGDDCWRFVFDSETETWKREEGVIDYNFESYTDEQMNEELIRRGYEVSKIHPENLK